jgi:hypothetical protein
MLFYANALEPVSAQPVFSGAVLPAPTPFGGAIDIGVPLIETLPEAPDVSILSLRSTIGPEHLTYYEEVNHRIVAYVPSGILLPDSCPRHGFQFYAELTFADGSSTSARTAVACPRARPKRKRSGVKG